MPDLATCDECRDEITDPFARRYRYPFTNCTHCGPRYTIIQSLPYDRPSTTMAGFIMCAACEGEYGDPMNRRFHAQPIACPSCGPKLELLDADGALRSGGDEALFHTAKAIRDGKIIALKGLGGFQLIADARNDAVVRLLRERKNRPAKPLAVMYPGLEAVRRVCDINEAEAGLLQSPQSPIVLVKKKSALCLAPSIAPDNPYLGVMLPYTPLHFLLLQDLGFPVIATSGNKYSEPICIDNEEAFEKLSGIADMFLMHDRPIARRADDSIIRVMAERPTVLRRARGYAPLPFTLSPAAGQPIIAVGGHLKNAVALAVGDKLVVSPHIGDLDTPAAMVSHKEAQDDLVRLYRVSPAVIAHDAHPDYASTRMAQESGFNTMPVQHHYAHALSCMVDNQIEGECLAVVWDGTGYGSDGGVWGGEFLKITQDGYERCGHLLPFLLPGGDKAPLEPRRAALGALYALQENFLDNITLSFSREEKKVLLQMLARNLNSPLTTSAGRLFDAVAALLDIRHFNTFEGEAAMALEFAAEKARDETASYNFAMKEGVLDWRPAIIELLADLHRGLTVSVIAARFHNMLSTAILSVAQHERQSKVLLTGGCFQNRLLLESTVAKLQKSGLTPLWHRLLPPNDGGIAAGQIMAVLREK